jgi:3'(2'), 5'-bisphosphate nucleotidase
LAEEAGTLLVGLRAAAPVGVGIRARVSLGTDGDRLANGMILARLAEARPGDAVLSEEAADTSARLGAARVWIVDPLDGTREFCEPERTDWAVHVALQEDGELVVGAVALPARGQVFATGAPLPPLGPVPDVPRMVVSRTRPPAVTESIRRALGAELVPMGSAGAKAMAVVQGDADVYAHAGGQYEWDSAAPVAVAAEAGLWVSRLDGSPLVYNRPDPWLPDLLICRPGLAGTVMDAARRWFVRGDAIG